MEQCFSLNPKSSTPKVVDYYLFYTILIEKGIKVYCYTQEKVRLQQQYKNIENNSIPHQFEYRT